MRSYRLYVTDVRGRIDKAALEIAAATDIAALAAAKHLVGEVPFEIWDGARRVQTANHGERSTHRAEP